MAINREKIKEIVEVFYQPTFKIFYINSEDGENFIKPEKVFVSLGMTTSLKGIENIKGILENNGFPSRIVEISSKKISGQFINTVTKFDEVGQFELTELGSDILGKTEAEKELKELREKIKDPLNLDVLREIVPKINQLKRLIDKYDLVGDWDTHFIQKTKDGEYKTFLKYVNYKKEDEVEYRIGILVG